VRRRSSNLDALFAAFLCHFHVKLKAYKAPAGSGGLRVRCSVVHDHRPSHRNLYAMTARRDIIVSHTKIMHWVLPYVPAYERRWERFALPPSSAPLGQTWRKARGCEAVIVFSGWGLPHRESEPGVSR
jgi:hypothetical protein